MWIKTVDDEAVNLDNIVVITARYVREYNYTIVVAGAVNDNSYNNSEYILWQHEGEAVEMAKEWIDEHILKMRGDNNGAYAIHCGGDIPVYYT